MTNIAGWIQKSTLYAERDALPGESVSVYVIDRNETMAVDIFYPIPQNMLPMYRWPRGLSDMINGDQNIDLKAGEKSADGTLTTLASSYRNSLWVPPEDSNVRVFTTCSNLSNWAARGGIFAAGDLPAGTTIVITVMNHAATRKYEELSVAIAAENTAMWAWPFQVAREINNRSRFIKAGRKDEENYLINPVLSDTGNGIWVPENSNLAVFFRCRYSAQTVRDIEHMYSTVKNANLMNSPGAADLARWHAEFSDGKFSDLDYPDNAATVTDTAPLYSHLTRIQSIASYIARSSAPEETCTTMAVSALNFYASQNYRTSNWWDRQVGLARKAALCAVLLAEYARNDALSELFLPYMIATTTTYMGQTGANQADFATIQLFWSLAGWTNTKRAEYIQYVFASSAAISSLCHVVDRAGPEWGEGISADYTISQHNPKNGEVRCSQLYTCSYGNVLLANIFNFMTYLSGSITLADDAIDGLILELCEGLGWHLYAGIVDFHPQGRAMSRGTMSPAAWAKWVEIITPYATADRQTALAELKARIQTKNESGNRTFIGSRAFWINDYLAHFTDKLCFWNKTISTRTVGSESGNGENIKGYYVGNGSYLITRTGGEYYDIQPVWDWERLPGTTVELGAFPGYPTWPAINWGAGAWGSDDFTGAISDGTVGVMAMTLSKGNIRHARKTNIVTPSQIVCLATSIDTSAASNAVVSSVAQDLFGGQATIRFSDQADSVLTGSMNITSANIMSVTHNGLIYDFSEYPGQNITINIGDQTGSWADINTTKSPTSITRRVFSIWINHGRSDNEGYGYRIYADDETNAGASVTYRCDGCHVLASSDKKTLSGTVYEVQPDATFELYGAITLAPLTPASFIARTDGSRLMLTSTDISQKGKQVEFNVSWQREFSALTQKINFPVQSGNEAGRSVTISIDFQ